MRYLSQLVRETASRVKVSRRPSWLRPVGLVPQEEAASSASAPVALPQTEATTPQSSESTTKATVKQNHDERPGRAQRAVAPGDGEVLPPHAAAPLRILPRRSEEAAPSAVRALTPRQAPAIEATAAEPDENDLFPEERRSEQTVPRQPETTHTLRSVLAELARRQQELERQQAEIKREPVVEAAPERGKRAERRVREAPGNKEDIRLNIGSIVVQMEPDPEARVAPPPQPLRPRAPQYERQSSDHWARSFLDR